MVLRKKVIGRNAEINKLDPEETDSEIAEPDRGMDGWASMFAAGSPKYCLILCVITIPIIIALNFFSTVQELSILYQASHQLQKPHRCKSLESSGIQ